MTCLCREWKYAQLLIICPLCKRKVNGESEVDRLATEFLKSLTLEAQ